MGGGSNHRSWLAAHLVQAAAGTDTAADEDKQNGDEATNTKDHGQRCVMIAKGIITILLFVLRKTKDRILTAVSSQTGTTAKSCETFLVWRGTIGHTVTAQC